MCMTIALLELKFKATRIWLWLGLLSQFETRSVRPRSPIEDSVVLIYTFFALFTRDNNNNIIILGRVTVKDIA